MTPTFWAKKGVPEAVLRAISTGQQEEDQDSRHWFLSSISALTLISCVTLEKSLTFSEPQRIHPQNRDNYVLCAFPFRIMGKILNRDDEQKSPSPTP